MSGWHRGGPVEEASIAAPWGGGWDEGAAPIQGRLPQTALIDDHGLWSRVREQPGNCRIEMQRAAGAARGDGSRALVPGADIWAHSASGSRVACRGFAGGNGATGSLVIREYEQIGNPF